MDKAEKIEETLNCLQGISHAKGNPFLFEKIKAELKSRAGGKSTNARVIFATALAVIAAAIINVTVWTDYSSAIKQHSESRQSISSFAGEYFNLNTTYNY